MNSEKVKEIKKALENNEYYAIEYFPKTGEPIVFRFTDILTCINELEKCSEKWQKLCADEVELNTPLKERIKELESENERLNKSDTSKEESSIEYYNLYKDLKRKNKDLNELCELQRVSIAESFVRENQLKDRIAELEEYIKANEQDAKAFVNCWHKDLETELKQFAERLKEEAEYAYLADYNTNDESFIEKPDFLRIVDETLKEFIGE